MKPEPVPKMVVCSLCGMDWEKHGQKPTAEKCVELVKAEMAKPRIWNNNITATSASTPPYFFGIAN